jgi:hypothetical protein
VCIDASGDIASVAAQVTAALDARGW